MSWISRLVSTVLPLQVTLQNPNILHSAEYTSSQNGQHGAVASESQECSQIGIDIMKLGGNAADAMIATTLCVGVIGMYHSGIAGGGFALVRSEDGVYEAVDFRETAPAAAHQDMYNGSIAGSVFGGLSAYVSSRDESHMNHTYAFTEPSRQTSADSNTSMNGTAFCLGILS